MERKPECMQVLSFILDNISRLPDDYMENARELEETFMKTFREVDNEQKLTPLMTGSSVEGLSLNVILHYPTTLPSSSPSFEDADLDVMMSDNRFVAATDVTENKQNEESGSLWMKIETGLSQHPGYCCLEVDEGSLQEFLSNGELVIQQDVVASFERQENGKLLLLSEKFAKLISVSEERMKDIGAKNVTRHGPAFTEEENNPTVIPLFDPIDSNKEGTINIGSSFDCVPAIEVSGWPYVAKEWITKNRKWPTEDVIETIVKGGCHVVPVSHSLSANPEVEWRLSFSKAEKTISQQLSWLQRKLYIFVKYIMWKGYLCEQKELSSYHLKTAFLWLLEEHVSMDWNEKDFAIMVFRLLGKVSSFIQNNKYPNHFIPENNMIDCLDVAKLQKIPERISGIQNDILLFLLESSPENKPLVLEDKIFQYIFKDVLEFRYTLELNQCIEEYQMASNTALLKLAKTYQAFEAFDYALQIYKELWHKGNDMELVEFIFDVSSRGMYADVEPVKELLSFHRYLHEKTSLNSEDIKETLAYLHYCLAGILKGAAAKSELETAEGIMMEIEGTQKSLATDFLKARIWIQQNKITESMELLRTISSRIEDEKMNWYFLVRPIEFECFDNGLIEILKEFSLSNDTIAVPSVLFVKYKLAELYKKSGRREQFEAICQEFASMLESLDLDEKDKEIGEHLLSFLHSTKKRRCTIW